MKTNKIKNLVFELHLNDVLRNDIHIKCIVIYIKESLDKNQFTRKDYRQTDIKMIINYAIKFDIKKVLIIHLVQSSLKLANDQFSFWKRTVMAFNYFDIELIDYINYVDNECFSLKDNIYL